MITIDELVAYLLEARETMKLKGETPVLLSFMSEDDEYTEGPLYDMTILDFNDETKAVGLISYLDDDEYSDEN